MMRQLIRISTWMLAVGFAPAALAQESDGFDQTQVITGDRTLTVDKAFKITEMPQEVDIPPRGGEITYSLIPRRPAIEVDAEPIEPARVKVREPLDPMYSGYVKGAVGTYQTPFLEAMYTSTRKRDFSYGVKYRHLSANRGVRNVAFSGFSQNEVAAWGKKIFSKHSLESHAFFNRDVWHYYGFDPLDNEIAKGDIRQRFELFGLDNKWRSYYRDSSKVNHAIDLKVYNLGDRKGANEFGIYAGGELHAYRGDQFYTMTTGLDLISYKSDPLQPFTFMGDTQLPVENPSASSTNAIVHATPQIVLRAGGLTAAAGIGLYAQIENIARFHAFPDAEVSYSLFNDLFIPYAGMTGSVNRVGYRTLSEVNPWVLNNLELRNSITRYQVFGGIRGSVSDRLSFNASVRYDQTDETPLFVNDVIFSAENRFSVIYDDISTFAMMGELTYANNEKFEANARVELLSYSTDQEAEAWHLPSHRISLGGKYHLFDKFSAGITLTWIGSREVKSLLPLPDQPLPEEGFLVKTLDPYLDLSLLVEYNYTARLAAFVQAHNLSASSYDIYYRFPAQRAFVMGGVKYAF